jgi:hypothetical protein
MLEIITTVLILLIVLIVLYWMKKTLFIFGFFFKLFTVAFLALLVISFVFGYLVIKDARDFSQNFHNSTSIFIITDNINSADTFLAGVKINPKEKSFDTLNEKELLEAEESYNSGNAKDISKEYYKLFIVDFKSFDELKIDVIEDRNINLTKDELKKVMTSKDARTELARIVSSQTGESRSQILSEIKYSNEEIKSYIFSYYLSTTFNPKNTAELLIQFKENDIRVYKETALFKAIKIIPKFLIKGVAQKAESIVD